MVTEVVLVLRVLSQLSNKANVDWYDFESTQQQQMVEQASRVLDMTIVLGLRAAVPSVTPKVDVTSSARSRAPTCAASAVTPALRTEAP